MSSWAQLLSVLAQQSAPAQSKFEHLLTCFGQNPDSLADIADPDNKDALHDFLISYSDRLASFIHLVHMTKPSAITGSSKKLFGGHVIEAIIEILPELCEEVEEPALIRLLVPMMALCVGQKVPRIQKLAIFLSDRTTLLQRLSTDKISGKTIQTWTMNASLLLPRDYRTLEAWTRVLVSMAANCYPGYHDLPTEISSFRRLIALIDFLMEMDQKNTLSESLQPMRTPKSWSELVMPKKSPLIIPEHIRESLEFFKCETPQSYRAVQLTADRLKNEKLREILSAVAKTFPCSRCKEILATGSIPDHVPPIVDTNVPLAAQINLEVLGEYVGTWKVLLSHMALTTLQAMPRCEGIRRNLTDLSNMCAKYKPAASKDQLAGLHVSLQQTKCGKDLSILWQIDIGLDESTRLWQQHIKVWCIGDTKRIVKAIDQVKTLHRSYSQDVIFRCQQRSKNSLPLSFSRSESDQNFDAEKLAGTDVLACNQEMIEMANKFYLLTQPVLRALDANNASAQFPFEISAEEADVIRHFSSSSLILGRSGTGKTTCLILKLVAKFLDSSRMNGKLVRQVLVTQSNHLAGKLRSSTRRLINTLALDTETNACHIAAQKNLDTGCEGESTDLSVLSLEDSSFPLVCDFDHFLRILEDTIQSLDRNSFGTSSRSSKVVDYSSFRLNYWPHFSSKLTRGFSDALVFSEIMGVIKGSSSSSETLRHLSRDQYLKRSQRQAPSFTTFERPTVYDIFRLYEESKIKRGEQDSIDRVMKILRAVRENDDLRKLLGSNFQELYIDEVQDQRTMDIELFLAFINDSRGLHLAGDTAQAIAQDTTFRFEDIKALIYNHFAAVGNTTNQPILARPTMFKLARNYRSHQGILRIASLVIDLIWKGYPDTVDKLKPEIGRLFGPMPTVFLGFTADILTASNIGHVQLSDNTADFGAEQVILVRDDSMKEELQRLLGDAALILTIRQSKGMEFDDVIIWDFFSRCPDATGIRNLKALMSSETAAKYATEHLNICSELKNLYVAITRARIQLFLIESSTKAMQPVLDLFQAHEKASIIDITSPDDERLAEKLHCLRPGYSVDPERWSLRGDQFMQNKNYKDALLCFRKAGNVKGESQAQAELHAEAGWMSKASGQIKDSILSFEAAKEIFLRLNLISQAAIMLEAMDRIGDAAKLWMQHDAFARAATLFLRANLWIEAADCYKVIGDISSAANALRRGAKFDELVEFMSSSRDQFDQKFYQGFVRLFKILLKQGKISSDHRKQAIGLLGSSDEQEKYLREYEMHEELLEMFKTNDRHFDVYSLKLELGQLEAALKTALEYNLASADSSLTESQVVHLIDYVLTEKAIKFLEQSHANTLTFKEPNLESLPDKIARRFQEWKIACRLLPWKNTTDAFKDFESLEHDNMKAIVSLLNIFYANSMTACSRLVDLPYTLFQVVTDQINGAFLRNSSTSKEVLMMVCGVRTAPLFGSNYAPLQWSPLAVDQSKELAPDAESFAYAKFSSAILQFQTTAFTLRSRSLKIHCLRFLAHEFCGAHLRRECDPRRVHRIVSASEYKQDLDDLFNVVNVLCGLTKLYYRRILPEEFQAAFLPMKRRWLEILIRQLRYTSALEQDYQALSTKRAEFVRGQIPPATIAAIEDLLFYRVRNEWKERQLEFKLFEDTQLAELLGRKVEARFYLALSFRAESDPERRRTFLPRLLKQAVSNFQGFENALNEFVDVLSDSRNVYMRSLSVVINELESVAAFLILKQSSDVSLLPLSWLARNCPWLAHNGAFETADLSKSEQTLRCFSSFGRRVFGFLANLQGDTSFKAVDLLRQRNAELLALIWVNLDAVHPRPYTPNLTKAWNEAIKIFGDAIYCNHVDYRKDLKNPTDLHTRLLSSFSRYHGKDALVLFAKKIGAKHSFNLSKDVRTIMLDDLGPYQASEASGRTSENSEQYSAPDLVSVTKVQRFWRKWFPRFKRHQTYMETSVANHIAKYIALGSEPLAGLPLRVVLVSEGPEVQDQLSAFQKAFSPLRTSVVIEIEKIEGLNDRYELLDDALHQCTAVEEDLSKISTSISEANMKALVKEGNVSKLSQAFSDATLLLQAVKIKIDSIRKFMST